MSILVFAEQRDKKIRKSAKEAISQGRFLADKLGQEVAVLLIGSEISTQVDEVKKYGPHEIYLADNQALELYNTETYSSVLTGLLRQLNPGLILMAHTAMGKDFAPRVAQRVGAGLVTDCVDIDLNEEGISFVRPFYAGKILARMKIATQVQFVTLRPNAFPPQERTGKTVIRRLDISLDDPRTRTVRLDRLESQGPDVTEADIIVSGGRGLGENDGFALVRKLAELLDAAVGASRAAVDAGWIDQQHQVGQTGKVVSPKVYFALGISGAIQHIAGMGTSKCIIAINKDQEANIHNFADYSIVGDLYDIVPVMIDKLKAVP